MVHTTLFVLAVLSLWPSRVPLQHSLLACRCSPRAIRVIRHPTLRRILHVQSFCAVGAVLRLSLGAPVPVLCFDRPNRYTLVKGGNITSAERCREAGRPQGCTRIASTHNTSLVPLLTLRRWQEDTSSPFSRPFVVGPQKLLPNSRETPAGLAKVKGPPTFEIESWSFPPFLSLSFSLFLFLFSSPSLALSLSCSLALSLVRSLSCRVHKKTDWVLSLPLSLSRPLSVSLSLARAHSLILSLVLLLSRSLALSFSCPVALALSLFVF